MNDDASTVTDRVPYRILSIIHSATFGGPHNQAAKLHAATDLVQIIVVLPDEPGDAADRLRLLGVEVVQMRLLRPRASLANQSLTGLFVGYPRQVRHLMRLIRARDIDLVEVHGLLNVDGALSGRLTRRGVIWQLIDSRPPLLLRWLMMPFVLLFADVIMTTGSALALQYPGLGSGRGRRRLATFVPPVDSPSEDALRASDRRVQVRRKLAIPNESVLIVSVGNINPQKGFEDLIEATAEAAEESPSLALRIRGAIQPGHEPYFQSLCRLATERGFPPETIASFEEGVTVGDLLVAADVFALSSRPRSEGMPTVMLEAMSFGLPIIATRVGAIEEIVEDGRTGILVPPDDAFMLRNSLRRIVSDGPERSRLGLAGRTQMEQLDSSHRYAGIVLEACRVSATLHSRRRSPAQLRSGS